MRSHVIPSGQYSASTYQNISASAFNRPPVPSYTAAVTSASAVSISTPTTPAPVTTASNSVSVDPLPVTNQPPAVVQEMVAVAAETAPEPAIIGCISDKSLSEDSVKSTQAAALQLAVQSLKEAETQYL